MVGQMERDDGRYRKEYGEYRESDHHDPDYKLCPDFQIRLDQSFDRSKGNDQRPTELDPDL